MTNISVVDLAATDRAGRAVKFDLAGAMRAIRAATGKGGYAQQMEAWRLGRGPGRLTFQEYFAYRLYDDSAVPRDDAGRFLSERIHWPLVDKCCDRGWRAMTEDKWLAYSFLANAGIAVPKTLAVIDRSQRTFGGTPKLATAAEIEAFLARAALPIFAKPNGEMGSYGAFLIVGYSDGLASLEGGGTLPAGELLHRLVGDHTYLLQAVVRNDPAVARFAQHVGTVRTMNLVWPDRVKTPFALLKIPARGNIADNYWRTGNLACAVEPDTGRILRAVSGKGPDLRLHETHPETGAQLIGTMLPHWPELLRINEMVARLYAPVRFQSLDIALTPEGPCVIEVNTGGSFMLPQIATGRGFLTPAVRGFFESAGWKFGKG